MNPDATPEITIPQSKSKVALLLLGSAAFVGGSIWIWSVADSQTRFSPLFLKGVAGAGVCFFGLCGLYGFVKLFDGRPGLIIDAEGIVDHSSAVAAGRIPWEEVTGIRVSEIAGQRFLVIEVVDPQKYVARGGFFKRMVNAANAKMTGSPINISANSLRLKFDDLLRVLTEALERHKRAGRIESGR